MRLPLYPFLVAILALTSAIVIVVNNWHWTEADYTKWTRARATELWQNVSLENDKFVGKVTELSSWEGKEASTMPSYIKSGLC